VKLENMPLWLLKIITKNNKPVIDTTPSKTEKIKAGERNSRLTAIAGSLRRQGLDNKTILDQLSIANQNMCDPPLADKEIKTIADSVSRYEPKPKTAQRESKAGIYTLDSVEPEAVEWLWSNRIPLGKLSLIVGDPGEGKSYLSLYKASRITTGRSWPDIEDPITKGSVILLTAEDGIADTVRVRADLMNADLEKIHIIQGRENPKKEELEFFDLDRHLGILESNIKKIGDVRLVIIDPVTAYLGKLEDSRNTTIRSVLAPVASLAERTRISIIGITHLNKDVTKNAIYRAMGSVAFVAAARAVWAIQRDREDETKQRRFFLPLKSNLSINPTTLAFSIGNEGVIFEPHPVDITADEALSINEEQEEHGALQDAMEWLKQALEDEPIAATDIYRMAEENRISARTLQRAKKRIKVEAYKEGMAKDRKWYWKLANIPT
jgi:putative DNA primase/helicase